MIVTSGSPARTPRVLASDGMLEGPLLDGGVLASSPTERVSQCARDARYIFLAHLVEER